MGIPAKKMFNHHLHHWVLSYIFPFFFILPHISLTFPSFPSKEHSVGMTVKGKAFGVFFFQLAAAHFDFWGVQSISNTPRIISSLGKSHGMVFNLALSCSDTVVIFLTCHISHYFSHIPFISLQRTHFWEAFGFDRFFIFFPVSGRVGWFWQLLTLIFGKGRISPLPLE